MQNITSKYREREEFITEIREEYFSTIHQGKEECLCRISLPRGEGKFSKVFFEELYRRAREQCEQGGLIRKYEQNAESRGRFAVTPYRYHCVGTSYRIDGGLLSCRIETALDARFPGGVHLAKRDGFLYDEECDLILPIEAILPPNIRREEKGRGRMRASYADDGGVHIVFADESEYLYPLENFLLYYRSIRKCLRRKRENAEKGIDKRRKV